MRSNVRTLWALASLTAFLFVSLPMQPSYAQPAKNRVTHAAAAAPRIDGFDVEPSAQPLPGNELLFTLYGTPGGVARVSIAGANGSLQLEEMEPGVYEGGYTIRRQDRITAHSTATANLRIGNRVASAVLDEPLVGPPHAHRPGTPHAGNGPRIDRFDVDPGPLVPGSDLVFHLSGTPRAVASVRVEGVRGRLLLEEVGRGQYAGRYTLRNRDRVTPDSRVTARLRQGDQVTAATLGRPLLVAAAPPVRAGRPARSCPNCGVVEAVNVVEVKGEGNALGLIAGGVAGALLGSQVGRGSGKDLATIGGAAAGALAGNELQKRANASHYYEVVVRLESGGTQTISYAEAPGLAVGTRVRIENGNLVRG